MGKIWIEKYFFVTMKDCDHPVGMVQRKNCIKFRFEREERFQRGSKSNEAIVDRTNQKIQQKF